MNDLALASFMAPQEGGSATLVFMVQMVAIFAIFYFLLIRPQRKEAQRHQEMISNIRKGHEIITSGGVVGTVVHVAENRLTIKSGENTRLVIDRSKVAAVTNFEGSDG